MESIAFKHIFHYNNIIKGRLCLNKSSQYPRFSEQKGVVMLYCPNCHYIVLEEDELRDLTRYLDCLFETSDGKIMENDSMRDDFHDILREWAGGEND